MIKEMKGWKVLSSGRYSCRAGEWSDSSWGLHYPVNVDMVPRVEGSKLFFFKYQEDARKFAKYYEKIVPCVAKNCVKVKWVGKKIRHIHTFWKLRRKAAEYIKREAPVGTYMAESITCLK